MVAAVKDALLATDFAPAIGGAHLWLYEVYRRWPTPVTGQVQDYSRDPELGPHQLRFDQRQHGALNWVRTDFRIREFGILGRQEFLTYCRIGRAVLCWRRNGVERIHCLRVVPDAAAVSVFSWRRSPDTIIYAHGEEFLIVRTSRELTWLARMALSRAGLVIANTHATANLVRQFHRQVPIAVVHPGVDFSNFSALASQREITRQRFGAAPQTTVLLTVARMETRKNHQGVLKVLPQLLREGLDIVYVIASDGPERFHLKKMVQRLNLSKQVHFTGTIGPVERNHLYAAADIFVMPSIAAGGLIEGFGIVFMEAAAAGLPAIAGRSGGQAEAVLDGLTGLTVDGTDLAALKQAIRRLATRPALRRRMGAAARDRAKRFDWQQVARRIHAAVGDRFTPKPRSAQ